VVAEMLERGLGIAKMRQVNILVLPLEKVLDLIEQMQKQRQCGLETT
jgi:hypothetical protein